MSRILASLALLLWLAGLPGCAWWDAQQRQRALRPTPAAPGEAQPPLAAGDERWLAPVPLPGGGSHQLALWWLPHANPQAPTLLYLHGTLRALPRNLPKMEALRSAGYSVLAVDYRGWGQSTPILPSEETIRADAAQAWAELVRRQPRPGARVIFGHSLGGAVAIGLAAELRAGRDYGGLIVESTFTRLPDVAAEAGVLGRLAAAVTTLDFDSLARIGRIDAPILMLHGDADTTVPVTLGRRLRDAAPAARTTWVEFPGGGHSRLHSEAPQVYQTALQTFATRLN